MAKPVYILLAESISEDRGTNLLSVFTIIERVGVQYAERSGPGKLVMAGSGVAFKAVLVSVWMREDGDSEHKFEHELVVRLPGGESAIGMPTVSQTFRFPPGDLQLHRVKMRISNLPKLEASGTVWLESRVRRQGDSEWMSQSYPLAFDVIKSESTGSEN